MPSTLKFYLLKFAVVVIAVSLEGEYHDKAKQERVSTVLRLHRGFSRIFRQPLPCTSKGERR